MKIQTLTTRQVRSIGAAWNTPLVSGAIYVAADDDGTGLDILVAALCRNEPKAANQEALRERIKTDLDAASRDVFEFGGFVVTP